MDILSKDFESISFEDIENFCKEKVVENIQLDYKKVMPKKGLSKHIAAFSNTKGGLIIIGVDEDSETGEPKNWEGIKKEGKLIDQVYQHASNVVPYPTIKARFTNVKNKKAFLLVKILEGGTPPYHTVSDPTIRTRTGNISTPLDTARQQDLDKLYTKKEKSGEIREQNIGKAITIYEASLDRADDEREQEIKERPEEKIYDKPFLPHASVLSVTIQPFYPETAIAERHELKSRMEEYRVTRVNSDFPHLSSEQCPGGISLFSWNRMSGLFESQLVLNNGLVFSAVDIQRPYEGVPAASMNEIASIIARQLKVSSNLYRVFGYTGVVCGEIKLSNLKGVRIYDLKPEGYQSWFDDGQITKISDYSWPIEDIDTNLLDDKKTFYQEWKKIMQAIFWDLGMPVPSEEKFKDYFEMNLSPISFKLK